LLPYCLIALLPYCLLALTITDLCHPWCPLKRRNCRSHDPDVGRRRGTRVFRKPPPRPRPTTSARDSGRADLAPFIGLTGSLRYGRVRHHLGSWQDSDHEGYGNRRVRPAHGARLSRLSRRRDAVLLSGVAGAGVVQSLSVVAIRHRRLSRPWYEGYLVPSRSTVFGLFLHVGEGLHFWPELVVQTACAIWVVSLLLRAAGFAVGPWHRTLIVA